MNANEARPAGGNQQLSLWIVLAIVAAMVCLWLIVFGPPDRSPMGRYGRAIGHKLPYFRLDPLTGDSKAIAPDALEGRVTLVNYWGTWCPPCQVELPHLLELAEEFSKHDKFRLYLVSCGDDGLDPRPDKLREATFRFLLDRDITHATYGDFNAANRREMVKAFDWEGMSYPTTLIIDQRAIIRGVWIGYRAGDEKDMRALLEKLLAEKPA